MARHLITLNAGSSSLKFAMFEASVEPQPVASGTAEMRDGSCRLKTSAGGEAHEEHWAPGDNFHEAALRRVLDWCGRALPSVRIGAAGHRVVHGGLEFTAPVRIDGRVMAALERLVPLAPLHQPQSLAGIRAAQQAFADAPQVACFDTAFHRGHPFVNDTFALPRRFYDEGVRRYGFHGLSYEYVAGRLREIAPEVAGGRVVMAHLGNGASMCAMRDGQSVASTMGFTALDGLPMGTRCGQLDPGVVLYLLQEKRMSAEQLSNLLYHESGLKGLSGVSSDMRDLEASDDPAAREAVEYFDFRVRRELGGLAAALGGLDGVVFTAGIGEHSWRVRERVLEGMGWLGIKLDRDANRSGATVISAPGSPVIVFDIPTDEEKAIARHTVALL